MMKQKMRTARCSQCGSVFRSKSRGELLKKVRRHQFKAHRTWLLGRMKAGRRSSELSNPSIQDMIAALGEGTRAALGIATRMRAARYQELKRVMDSLEPILPEHIRLSWRAVEAAHDAIKAIKGRR